jgi:hypothetical protein
MTMHSRLELLDRETWQDFLSATTAVLILGKSDCKACAAWTLEVESFLREDTQWTNVRFGKIDLDRGGLGGFKKANTWLAEVTDLPFTIIYVDGERKKEFLGSGIQRLINRIQRVVDLPQ